MSSLGIIAAVPGNIQQNAKESVRREIIRNIACPDFVSNDSETNQVKAIVEVDENGNVNVSDINSSNEQLKDYVVEQLHNLKVKSSGTTEKFVLVIKFKAA
jgi:hypothetical protein